LPPPETVEVARTFAGLACGLMEPERLDRPRIAAICATCLGLERLELPKKLASMGTGASASDGRTAASRARLDTNHA
jgi:hypothetical protein